MQLQRVMPTHLKSKTAEAKINENLTDAQKMVLRMKSELFKQNDERYRALDVISLQDFINAPVCTTYLRKDNKDFLFFGMDDGGINLYDITPNPNVQSERFVELARTVSVINIESYIYSGAMKTLLILNGSPKLLSPKS
jgi:hypothetical protein